MRQLEFAEFALPKKEKAPKKRKQQEWPPIMNRILQDIPEDRELEVFCIVNTLGDMAMGKIRWGTKEIFTHYSRLCSIIGNKWAKIIISWAGIKIGKLWDVDIKPDTTVEEIEERINYRLRMAIGSL